MGYMRHWCSGLAMVAILLGGVGLGWLARSYEPGSSVPIPVAWETPLGAAGAVASDRYAMATGPVDNEVEGLFLLDFASGQLQCTVLNMRSRKFAAVFQTNVLQDLPAAARRRAPQYLLTTGQIAFPRIGPAPAARSVCYVLDATTGNYAAYALQWRPDLAVSGRPQVGNFLLLDTGNLSATPASDQLTDPRP